MDKKVNAYIKRLNPGHCLPLVRVHAHVYKHYFQTISTLKPLGQSKPFLYGASLGRVTKVYINSIGRPRYPFMVNKLMLQNQKSDCLETCHSSFTKIIEIMILG